MPAAAVKHRMRALPGLIGRKVFLGGYPSFLLKIICLTVIQHKKLVSLSILGAMGIFGVVVKYVEFEKNTGGESALLGYY